MDDLCASVILQIPDPLFCPSVLPMGVDPTERNGLLVLSYGLKEGVVRKSAIIGMVVLDGNSHGFAVRFERKLGSDRFFS